MALNPRRFLLRPLLLVLAVVGFVAIGPLRAVADDGGALDWWEQNFEIHGYLKSTAYFRSPNLNIGREFQLSSWRNELELDGDLNLYDSDFFKLSLHGIIRPTYDAVMDLYPDIWGGNTKDGALFQGNGPGSNLAKARKNGHQLEGFGACVRGEFCLGNNDTGTLFTGEPAVAAFIDDVIFYGGLPAPWNARGTHQANIGGDSRAFDFQKAINKSPFLAGAPFAEITADLALASKPVKTPLNWYHGAPGNRRSFQQSPVPINLREANQKFDCMDNAHPYCFLREAYADLDLGNTHFRIGRQIVIWGKTDSFRLQDVVNPLDLGFHNVFPDLEERYIPQWILDATHRFGNVGPIQDLSLEFVWNFDRFIPVQVGQCGEPYAFTAACEARADANGHTLLNISLAGAQTKAWSIRNTEPGLRLEFRIPDPAMSFSLSAYYGFWDAPYAKFLGDYSVNKPNPAIFMFFQGLGLGPVIEALSGAGPGTTPWTTGFDPYAVNKNGTPITGSTLEAANNVLRTAWANTAQAAAAAAIAGGADPGKAVTATGLQILNFAWGESEAQLRYPRVLSLGGSADYQIPNIDTVLRTEVAYDIGRKFFDSGAGGDLVTDSSVFKASIGLDRSTFIPFLNPDRTAFLSFQTFAEWITNYHGGTTGMVDPQVSLISTAFMQNYWRNDTLVLTNFVAYDWNAGALITGPKFRWVYNSNLFFDVGLNLLWGKTHMHNIKDLCPSGKLDCLGQDPSTWNNGNWQGINRNFQRTSEAPFWGQESFADHFMEKRDEVYFSVTYQF